MGPKARKSMMDKILEKANLKAAAMKEEMRKKRSSGMETFELMLWSTFESMSTAGY